MGYSAAAQPCGNDPCSMHWQHYGLRAERPLMTTKLPQRSLWTRVAAVCHEGPCRSSLSKPSNRRLRSALSTLYRGSATYKVGVGAFQPTLGGASPASEYRQHSSPPLCATPCLSDDSLRVGEVSSLAKSPGTMG